MPTKVEIAIVKILDDSVAVGAIVSNRIYPMVAPQEADRPYITYQKIANEPTDTKDGVSTIDVVRMDIDCWSDKDGGQVDILTLADVVRTALDRTSGTFAGVVIQSIRFMNSNSDYNQDAEIYHITQEYSIRHAR